MYWQHLVNMQYICQNMALLMIEVGASVTNMHSFTPTVLICVQPFELVTACLLSSLCFPSANVMMLAHNSLLMAR